MFTDAQFYQSLLIVIAVGFGLGFTAAMFRHWIHKLQEQSTR